MGCECYSCRRHLSPARPTSGLLPWQHGLWNPVLGRWHCRPGAGGKGCGQYPPSLGGTPSLGQGGITPLQTAERMPQGALRPWQPLVRVARGSQSLQRPQAPPLRARLGPPNAQVPPLHTSLSYFRQLLDGCSPEKKLSSLSPSWPDCQSTWFVPLSHHIKDTHRSGLDRSKYLCAWYLEQMSELFLSGSLSAAITGKQGQAKDSLSAKGEGFKIPIVTRFSLILLTGRRKESLETRLQSPSPGGNILRTGMAGIPFDCLGLYC